MAVIVENVPVARDIYRMKLSGAPGGAAGQFVMLRVPGALDPFLGRPISLFDSEGDETSLLYQAAGRGTALFAGLKSGQEIEARGPYGNGFPLVAGDAVLIGGGIGCAPLQYLADELAAAGAHVTAALGFRDFRAARAVGAFTIERLSVATEDGSVGRAGTVLHLLAALDVAPGTTVYACGPTPMIAAVQRWTFHEGLRGYVSLEAHMACGTGSCHGCVVDTARGKLRVCSEGPVFRLDEVTP